MYVSQLRVALLVIILSTTLGVGLVTALLETSHYIIPSSGLIGLLDARPSVAHRSEIRALFIHAASWNNPDWELITQTAKDQGANVLVGEALANTFARYPSSYIPGFDVDVLAPGIAAAHARGLEFHVAMCVLGEGCPEAYLECRVIGSDGNPRPWMCPTKTATRNLLKNLVEELLTLHPNMDGFMFDYHRYNLVDECYCEDCHAKFVQDTGLPDVNWSADVVEGGRYHKDFMEWRLKPITELVRDIRSWMLAIKPDLEFSAAVWSWIPDYPTYWRYWIGQDWVDWIAKGYLDWVSPMMYTTNLDWMRNAIKDYQQIAIAGPEGKIPLVPFITNCFPSVVPPDQFKLQIDLLREEKCDGWIIWRYGGPGDYSSGAPDIRDYLSIIDCPQTFALRNVTATPDMTTATISWATDLPATTQVECSISPLFNASFVYSSASDFHYWDIDHAVGTIVEDTTPVTYHSITLTDLQEGTKYYFRVQSHDQFGIATSKVYTFEL